MPRYDFVTSFAAPSLGGNIYQGDPWTFAPSVWRYVIERFSIRSVLDVGSGRGHSAEWFFRQGLRSFAIDGLLENVATAIYPTIHHDLRERAFYCPVDLVHCQEVVEHIPEDSLFELLLTLANGQVILLSHGEPGQPGHSHVNLQTSDYWISAIEARGYRQLPDDTDRIRRLAADEGAHHLARSGLLFARTRRT